MSAELKSVLNRLRRYNYDGAGDLIVHPRGSWIRWEDAKPWAMRLISERDSAVTLNALQHERLYAQGRNIELLERERNEARDELEVCRAANERLMRELSAARADNVRLGALLDAAKEVRASDKAEINSLKKRIADMAAGREGLIDALGVYQERDTSATHSGGRVAVREAVREVVAIARDRTWYQDGHGNWDKTVLLFEASGKIDIPRGTTVTIRPVVAQTEAKGG